MHPRPIPLALASLLLASPAAAHGVEVEGREFAFEPSRVQAEAGESVTIEFENVGKLSHNLTIPAFDADTGTIQAGDTATLKVTPEEPGTYEIRCSVPGHAPAGMTGKLVVE
jgi:plastocyanin